MNFIVSYILPIFWFIVLAFLLKRNKYFKENSVPAFATIGFFAAKCLAGFVYTYIALKFIPNRGDIWPFYEDGLQLYQTFLRSPTEFFTLIKQIFTITDLDVTNTNSDFIRTVFEGIKFIHFLLNLLSGGNLWTNTILFNGLAAFVFLRCWVCLRHYCNSWSAGAWLFLFPSAFLYTSGIHKEGIVMLSIAAVIPLCFSIYNHIKPIKIAGLIVLLAVFFFFKFFVATTFIAVLVLWLVMEKGSQYKKTILLSSTTLAIAGFFLSVYTPVNLPNYLVSRQQEFLILPAASRINVPVLEPNIISFCKSLPSAINISLFKPLPGEGGKAMYLIYTAEIFAFWALLLFVAFKNRFRIERNTKPFFYAMLVFAVVNLLVIGYTIPSIGPVVRYRSVFLPFFGLFVWLLFAGDKNLTAKLRSATD